MNAPRYARQALTKEIESITGASLICYVSPSPRQIDRTDVVAMVDLLHNVTPGAAIDLLLHSPGGDIDAAEKLMTLIRKRAGTAKVRIIVPDYAKSAATLLALGADTIVMSDSSELGAIDPQVDLPDSNGHISTLSAQSYLDAFHLHAKSLKENPSDPVARLMLEKMEPATVRKLERITKRSRAIAEDLLKQAMVKDEKRATDIANKLSDTKRWHSHGQMISHENAAGLGLDITYLAPNDPEWLLYWRLYSLQLWAADGNIKLFESSWASLPMS
jgi:ClpP class serine protease